MTRRDPPPNLDSLTKRIANLATETGRPVRRIQRAVANTVIGQVLPPGVVKGGTALKLRVGEAGSRFTPDLDVARSSTVSLEDYLDALDENLAVGWSGFTGRIVTLAPAEPAGVPADYVMQPFDLKVLYRGKSWLTVRFELGHDEIGSTATPELRIADDLVEMFETLGLDRPQPVPVLAIEHQVAQKLHACTSIGTRTGTNDRAHDLVDLQVLDQDEAINPDQVGPIAIRLFAARQAHAWPPVVVAHDGWATLYTAAAEGLDVLPDVELAVVWTNELISSASR